MSESENRADNDPLERDRGHSAAEWIALLLSSLLIAAVAGAVAFFTLTRGSTPPTFRLELHAAETRGEAETFYLPVTVTNSGDEPAQEIRVRVDVRSGEQTETAVFTIEQLAAGESAEGTAVFREDPASGDLRAVVESFL